MVSRSRNRQAEDGNGRAFSDIFERTPKLHTGIDIDKSGKFSVLISIDMIELYNGLRRTYTFPNTTE